MSRRLGVQPNEQYEIGGLKGAGPRELEVSLWNLLSVRTPGMTAIQMRRSRFGPVCVLAVAVSGVARTVSAMGVQGPGESVNQFIGRPIPSHPFAVPAVKDTFGAWQVRRDRRNPIGYVLHRSLDGRTVYDAYAHCRDEGGKRPWLRTFASLNSAVAWMIQHEADLRAFNNRHNVEPDTWPA